jgi:hypothetical protein
MQEVARIQAERQPPVITFSSIELRQPTVLVNYLRPQQPTRTLTTGTRVPVRKETYADGTVIYTAYVLTEAGLFSTSKIRLASGAVEPLEPTVAEVAHRTLEGELAAASF